MRLSPDLDISLFPDRAPHLNNHSTLSHLGAGGRRAIISSPRDKELAY